MHIQAVLLCLASLNHQGLLVSLPSGLTSKVALIHRDSENVQAYTVMLCTTDVLENTGVNCAFTF